jgi:nucleoside-diphosphate-sugar epimerase
MSKTIHTVFGAGQVGTKLAQILAEEGYEVRLVRRSAPGPAMAGVTWMQGDVTDPAFADRACDGVAVVYNCVNPAAYHKWDELLPPLATAVREAAARAGARLVVLDNLYMYGRPQKTPFDESHPVEPCSKKGALRARLAEELWAAHEAGEVDVAVGRASDFFGPDTPNAAIFHKRFLDRLRAGKAVEVMGDPDQPHSYSYTPDVARGLAILGTHEAAVGKVWHLPVAAQTTTRELVEAFAAAAGVQPKIRRLPSWALRGLGVVVPLLGAVAEMLYQWETPFVVDDSQFRRVFGVGPTPLSEAIASTVGSAAPEIKAA